MTVRYSAIGETTVEVPAWVAEAKAVHENRTSDATEEALVDENGVVREYRVAYTATLGENTSRIERTVQFTALGETTVERPAWVAEETNATAASVQFASSATVGAGATFAVTSAR